MHTCNVKRSGIRGRRTGVWDKPWLYSNSMTGLSTWHSQKVKKLSSFISKLGNCDLDFWNSECLVDGLMEWLEFLPKTYNITEMNLMSSFKVSFVFMYKRKKEINLSTTNTQTSFTSKIIDFLKSSLSFLNKYTIKYLNCFLYFQCCLRSFILK